MASKQTNRRLRAKARQAASEMQSVTLEAAVAVSVVEAADGQARLPQITIDAYNGGTMRPRGLYGDVVVDLSGIRKASGSVPILKDHNHSQVVGHADVTITDKITATGVISGGGPAAAEVAAAAKNGFPWKASIGLAVERALYLDEDEEAQVNGTTVSGPMTVVRQSLLGEISVLPWAADATTSVRIAASHFTNRSVSMTKEFKAWLEAKGFDAEDITDQQVASLEAAWKVESSPPPSPPPADPSPPNDPIQARREQEATETTRISEIRTVCAGQHPDIEAQAIREGWDPAKVELQVLRAERQTAPAIHSSSHEPATGQVLEAACVMTGGLADADKIYKPEILEAAEQRYRHGIGLQELLLEAAWANGYQGRRFKGDMDGVLRAAFSTKSLAGILGNTANKFLMSGFMHVEQTWREISSKRSVNDFKQITSYRMTGDMQFVQVGPAGEIKHGEIDEESYTNQAKTYAKMFAITREDLINDDLGALTAVPRKLGRGAGLAMNHIFWTEFMDNSTFFTAARGNYQEGAGTVLGSAGLQAGVILFRKLTDPDGKPLATTPKLLLVPPDIEVTADELYVSTNINTGGSATTTKVPNRNVFAGKYRPIVSSYLSNSSYTGYSVTAWYLLADPLDMPTIEVAFLNGRETPVVESADADFNVLGIQMRGYFDFGVNKTEYRGGVMSKGGA